MNDNNTLVSLPSAKYAHVYSKSSTEWRTIQTLPVAFDAVSSISVLRRAVIKLVNDLGECRIAAGARMSGFVYNELSQNGFSIFEITDINPGVLDGILADLATDPESDQIDQTRPVETATAGVYTFDLIQFQAQFPDRSSKQALTNFLKNTPFFELQITCSHVPPWLEQSYQVDIQTVDSGITTAVVRKIQ